MKKRIELDVAKKAIKSAFLPLQCSVEDLDNGNRVGFRVFNENGDSLLSVNEVRRVICNATRLQFIILKARANLEKRGVQLLPWEFQVSTHPV